MSKAQVINRKVLQAAGLGKTGMSLPTSMGHFGLEFRVLVDTC